MPRHKNQVNFDPDTKTKSFSIPTQKQVNSDPFTEIKSISIPHIEIKSISTTHTKRSQVRCSIENQVTFGSNIIFSNTHTKNKTIDLRIKNESFSARTKEQVSRDPRALKPSQFQSIHETTR